MTGNGKRISSAAGHLETNEGGPRKLREKAPDRIVTLRYCSVSVVPFLSGRKISGEVAVVWIDAHPDVNLPYDEYGVSCDGLLLVWEWAMKR